MFTINDDGTITFDFNNIPFGVLMNVVFIDSTSLRNDIVNAFVSGGFSEEHSQEQADLTILQIRDGVNRTIDACRNPKGYLKPAARFIHNPSSHSLN